MRTSHRREIESARLLYDPELLQELFAKHGHETEIKNKVKTSAKLYEIRTALRYWVLDSQPSHRTSDRIWKRCKAVDDGRMALVDGELTYPDEA